MSPAKTTAEALEIAARDSFDMVISDIGLPDGSGIELMQTLKETYGLRGIAVTGYGMQEDMRQAYEAGFVQHLTKSVEFAQLRTALVQASAGRDRDR